MTTHTAPEPLVLNAAEVAELFGRDGGGKLRVSKRTIERHAEKIPGLIKIGGKKLWRRGPLVAWLEDVKMGTVVAFRSA